MRALFLGLMAISVSCGAPPCSGTSCVDAGTGTGGGSAATGGGSAATGGGSAATGGGSAATGGGSAATGGGSAATGGGSAATGGGSAGTGGGNGATGGGGGFMLPDAGTPPSVSVTTGSCMTVTPCAGTLTGTWFYTAACADDPLADIKGLCPTVSTITSTSTLTGRLDFSGTSVIRQVNSSYAMTINVPDSCVMNVGCATIQTVLPNATCSAATGPRTGCDCQVSGTSMLNESGSYTAAAGVVTLTLPSKTRTFNTCVTGSTLVTRETTNGLTSPERGTTTLTRP
jgi:hypothetical protein